MIFHHPRTRHAGRVLSLTGVVVSLVGLLTVAAGHSVGNPEAAATVKGAGGTADLATGNSGTVFTLRLPAGAACPGDSANGGYRWHTYMVPAAVDPGTLTFGSAGPLPPGQGAAFRQPLYDVPGGGPIVNQQTANADPSEVVGRILNIPDMDYAVFGAPDVIAAGTYNIGIACTLGPPGPSQTKNFWNVQKTFVAATTGGGPSSVTWTVASTSLPTATTVAGATTTTVAGATTTTVAGATTTTTAGNTTTTSSTGETTTTTTDGTATTGSDTSTTEGLGSTGTTAGVGFGVLSRTGGLPTSLLFWAALLLVFGRMTVLFVRTPEARSPRRR